MGKAGVKELDLDTTSEKAELVACTARREEAKVVVPDGTFQEMADNLQRKVCQWLNVNQMLR